VRFIITLFFFAQLFSCNHEKDNDSKIFLGTFRIMDQMVPYPSIIKQSNDSMFLFNSKGHLIDKVVNNKIKKNKTIEFKEIHFNILNIKGDSFYVFDLLDTIRFRPYKNGRPNPKNSARFTKIQPNADFDIESLKTDVKNIIWQYDVVEDENSNPNKDLKIKQIFRFMNDSVTMLYEYYYEGQKIISEYETKKYNLFKIDNVCFLSFHKQGDNPQPIYQILNYNSDTITLKDFSSRDIKEITCHKTFIKSEDFDQLINQTNRFSNCFDGYQGEYYFGDDVTHNKGNKFIIDYVKASAPNKDIKSGYVIVHFNINCVGNVGRFGLIQMDRNYKKTLFSKELVNHILNKVHKLDDFPSSYSQLKWLEYKDVHAFLMFKIQDGKIIDLCP